MKLIIFTDLDGTLLDHASYDFSKALPALSVIKEQGIPLILASSKTGAEIVNIRTQVGADNWPAIIENGAGELAPGSDPAVDFSEYNKLRDTLDQIPIHLRTLFRGFGDMSASEVSAATGLSLASAQLAKQRAFTEPGVFTGTKTESALFCKALLQLSVSARDGGRFMTLSFGRSKADGLRRISARLKARETLALGDAPNDRDMLLAATQAVIIRNDHAPDIGEIPGALYTTLTGPEAWNDAVLSLINSPTLIQHE